MAADDQRMFKTSFDKSFIAPCAFLLAPYGCKSGLEHPAVVASEMELPDKYRTLLAVVEHL